VFVAVESLREVINDLAEPVELLDLLVDAVGEALALLS